MTSVMEREVKEVLRDGWHLDKDGRPCGTKTHDTSWAYRSGCRNDEAWEAKRAIDNIYRRNTCRQAGKGPKPIESPAATCTAARHYASVNAWRKGCTCPGAVEARERDLQGKRDRYAETLDTVADRDPRAPWRTDAMRCDRMNLWLLLHGVPQVDHASGRNVNTKTERMVAVMHWTGRLRHPSGQLYTDIEIGRRLGIVGEIVARLRAEPERRRGRRTQRRLAESQWRALRNERLAALSDQD